MRRLFLASVAAVALACGATAVSGQATGASPPATLTSEQQASYAGWPAQAKDYPVCSKTVTDSCRNRGGK